MAEWLCSVVGPQGEVVATDLDTKFVSGVDAANLEVREHNIVSDPLEVESFDLIHTRAVLDHLPERDAVLQRLVDALRPGGWIVILGGDFSTVRATGLPPDEAESFERGFATVVDSGRAVGFDPFYGRRLGVDLRPVGLAEVSVEGSIFEWDARHPLAQLYSLTFQRLRPMVLQAQALSAGELDRLFAMMMADDFHGLSNTSKAERPDLPCGETLESASRASADRVCADATDSPADAFGVARQRAQVPTALVPPERQSRGASAVSRKMVSMVSEESGRGIPTLRATHRHRVTGPYPDAHDRVSRRRQDGVH